MFGPVESQFDNTACTPFVRVLGNRDFVPVYDIPTRHDLCRISSVTKLRSSLPIGEILVSRGAPRDGLRLPRRL
jgi:hypothetical protein